MKCFRCGQTILEEDNYFVIGEMDNKKEVDKSYVHKICWNRFLSQVGSVEESMGIIRGLKKWFISKDVLPKEEIKIVS